MKFNTAGEKRKFYRNMRENVSARQIGVAGLGFMSLLGPLALVLFAVVAIWGFMHFGSDHGSKVLAAASPVLVPLVANINGLRQKDIGLKNEGLAILGASKDRSLTAEERTRLDAITAERKTLGEDISRVETFLNEERVAAAAAGEGARVEVPNGAKKPWASLGEQLSAVAKHARTQGQVRDERLYAAALGSNESTAAEGGFLIAPEFTTALIQRTYEVGEISSRCAPMTMNSNRVIVNAVDEDSRADGSRWGGIAAYWLAEAGTYTATKPKFRQMQFIANKLTGLLYATDEQLDDSAALGSFANEAFPKEFAFKIDDAVVNGSGAGQPLGVLNSGAVIAVAKENAQANTTIVTNNVLNMWSRLFATSRKTACWLVNQDVEPQLYPLTLGSGTAVQLLYMPAGTPNNPGPYAKLMGRDVIPVEQCATLGTQGDILLCDFQQYVLAKKAEMKADTSIHVAFLTGEQAFRFQLRLDGQPTWKKPLTPKNGSNTLSAFIALAGRP